MTIFLIEKDPFVRMDISEALTSAYPDANLITFDGLDAMAEARETPDVILLDASPEEVVDDAFIHRWSTQDLQIVFTAGNDQSSQQHNAFWRTLERPFTDDMLLKAVNLRPK
ncbi:hypothetical protein ACERZ8_18460 [Tateyamaria armeniaca]|uniref:Response regulatory domain-containing protein n=1 Tax=Tateyamaria armeniaca TaxID=2518930 RepID=A0ABW8V199_9RHOB